MSPWVISVYAKAEKEAQKHVYIQLDRATDTIIELFQHGKSIKDLNLIYEQKLLRFFTARFEPKA